MTDQFRELRHALVGPNNTRLYHSSAQFKFAVDTLANMLPAMVDGLAGQAKAYEDKMSEEVRRMMTDPSLLFARTGESIVTDILTASNEGIATKRSGW